MDGRFEGVVWWPMPRQRPAHELWRQAVFKGIFLPLTAALLFQKLRMATSSNVGHEGIETNSSFILRPGDEGKSIERLDRLDNKSFAEVQKVSSEPFQTVELQEDNRPWQIHRLLVPLSQEVAMWWNNTDDFIIWATPCQHPHSGGLNDSRVECLHLEVKNAKPFSYHGRNVQAIETEIILPKTTVVKECRFSWVQIRVDLPEIDGTLRALHLSCRVTPQSFDGGGLPGIFALVFFGWLLLPWPLLLLPTTIMYTAAQPILVALAFCVASLSRCLRRRRRLWRLSSLGRRKVPVNVAYGEGEPCCICFGTEDEANICLLPCRHSLHAGCYRSWICTDSYPSRDLICPICRRKVTGVGKLV
ncbi:RING-type domain-containing protein [Durusdinium trenchii]|uniref:RING-type domain-containing protein n=1 Tax=Durusdinium trenchii TaxID=1381693 RepID=A0ABP0JJX1_9DINO